MKVNKFMIGSMILAAVTAAGSVMAADAPQLLDTQASVYEMSGGSGESMRWVLLTQGKTVTFGVCNSVQDQGPLPLDPAGMEKRLLDPKGGCNIALDFSRPEMGGTPNGVVQGIASVAHQADPGRLVFYAAGINLYSDSTFALGDATSMVFLFDDKAPESGLMTFSTIMTLGKGAQPQTTSERYTLFRKANVTVHFPKITTQVTEQ